MTVLELGFCSTLCFFLKNIVFPAQADYIYSSVKFALKIFL